VLINKPEGIITRRLCIRGNLALKMGGFDFKVKGLEDLTKGELTDKTSLHAMFLFNH